MCKLAGWSSIPHKKLPKATADSALQSAFAEISKTERDGFGFAQPSSLLARFVNPACFKSMGALPDLLRFAGDAASAFKAPKSSAQQGDYDPSAPMLIHGRTATCGVSMENTHPFTHKGWTLAHNGVVTWHGPKKGGHDKVTCDSQHLILCLGRGRKAKADMLNLTGYAAFIAFAPDGRMIVARDDTARLYAAVLPNGRWVFGTTADIAEGVAAEFTSSDARAFLLDDNVWLEFPPGGGKPKVSKWKIGAATKREIGFASRSLGVPVAPSTSRQPVGGNLVEYRPSATATSVQIRQPVLGETRHSIDSSGQAFPKPATPGDRFTDAYRVTWEKAAKDNYGWRCVALGSTPTPADGEMSTK